MPDQPASTVDSSAVDADQDLLTLDEAVDFLRGAYASRTLQNLAWDGTLRHVGRGKKMRFLRRWLLDDLLALRRIDAKESEYEHQREDDSWSSEKAHPGAARTGASARDARSRAESGNAARKVAAKRPRRCASRSSGTSTAGANANSRTAGARQDAAEILRRKEADYWRQQELGVEARCRRDARRCTGCVHRLGIQLLRRLPQADRHGDAGIWRGRRLGCVGADGDAQGHRAVQARRSAIAVAVDGALVHAGLASVFQLPARGGLDPAQPDSQGQDASADQGARSSAARGSRARCCRRSGSCRRISRRSPRRWCSAAGARARSSICATATRICRSAGRTCSTSRATS